MSPEQIIQAMSANSEFFELMRRVQALQDLSGESDARLGGRAPDWLRLGQVADMSFAALELSQVRWTLGAPRWDEGRLDLGQLEVEMRHFGLFAPYGPLAIHVTEQVMHERDFERNLGFERFLNALIGHVAWLYFQARARMDPLLGLPQGGAFQHRLSAMSQRAQHVFFKPASQPPADQSAAQAACDFRDRFAGIYLGQHRPLGALQRALQTHFAVPVRIRPRLRRWGAVPVGDAARGSGCGSLGRWTLGRAALEVQSCIEIEIGPLQRHQISHWGREKACQQALLAIVNDYSSGAVQPRISLSLRTDPSMSARLGRMRVGHDSWLNALDQLVRVNVHEPFWS